MEAKHIIIRFTQIGNEASDKFFLQKGEREKLSLPGVDHL
jgi:hypothetical protein